MHTGENNTVDTSKFMIATHFKIEGNPIKIEPFGSGHINDTYKVQTDAGSHDYLLQRINNNVFKNVEQLMQNVKRVTAHLWKKLIAMNVPEPEKSVLTLIPTVDDKLFFKDENDNYWRVFNLIDQTKSYDIVENIQQAAEGGRAFGRFQAMLSDLDTTLIHESIPNFCHIGSRLINFHKSLDANVAKRKDKVAREIDFVLTREDRMNTILDMAERGEISLRITHNDTKFNNVLLDKNDRAQCVIDLDTVMPGYIAYDFGDAIRTIINKAAEDEADLNKIVLNIPLFEAYTKGYFEEACEFLTPKEVESLIEGVLLFPYMQAVRFLTDYLDGDTYYKIHHPEHNLQRTRAQIKLVEEIEKHVDELKSIIKKIAADYHLNPTL